MMLPSRLLILSICLTLGVSLVGCSRAPSQDDIDAAYRLEVDQVNQLSSRFGGTAMTIRVNEVKKLDCTARAQKEQFDCQVEIDSTLPFVGKRREMTTLTLSKGEQGWRVLRGAN